MQQISGGVCAAQGFSAGGVRCGLKKKEQPDLALVVSSVPAKAAATYTRNVVQAAPIHVSKRHLADGTLQAVIVNAGNANACAPDGEQNALLMCEYTAKALGIATEQVAVSSTGVIGQSMTPKMGQVEAGIEALAVSLTVDADGSDRAAKAIMTTDLTQKEAAIALTLGGKAVHIGGIAKGSGMIHPNMGTMLCFLTTDAAISSDLLQQALRRAVDVSFNRISVDGDCSTNDFCVILANGLAGNAEIQAEDAEYAAFLAALTELCIYLAREIAADGEGATHLLTCTVQNAPSEQVATTVAKSVIGSSLVKSAFFGRDANWGRILCAMGYSGAEFDPELVAVSFVSVAGEVQVCKDGRGLGFDEELALRVLEPHEVEIRIDMGQGSEGSVCWGCDLTYDYVKINGSYRS
ncbi:MAG: bifunctional glutamate N-acetyltransferase/amino-acid acetyltransferase ArgJ [Oscillospiraceae bacterium]|nr:bifunctional glutamate N-acetyltransferase/amino-acid acetyltransferase ArgJ [Oscillospiraceae bacterium]